MNLSPLPIQQFFSNNGRPLVGGKLFTYQAGTSTKQATYTDAGGLTPNTNPVVLNFRGEANVWLDPALTYKFVLSPANDTDPPTHPIWTVDDIPGYAVMTQDQFNSLLEGSPPYVRTAAEIAAGITPSNLFVPSHESSGVFYPARYGVMFDSNAAGSIGTDDTAAWQRMTAVVNEVGGGVVQGEAGRFSKVFSATTGTLCAFDGCEDIHVFDCMPVVPVSKVITTSEGYFFYFNDCNGCGGDRNHGYGGPTLDVSQTSVKGYELFHFVGCTNICMPSNEATNMLSGVTFYGQNGSGIPDSASRSRNITIGLLKVTNCWYGFNSQFSGDNLVCDELVTDTVHRSVFAYGCSNVLATVRAKDFKAKDICLFAWNNNVNGSQPLKDIEIHYHVTTDSDANAINGDRVYFGSWGVGPCVVDDIRVYLHVELAATGQGGPVVTLTKLNNSFSPDTTTGRGHAYKNIGIYGVIEGFPDTSSNGIVCIDSNADFTGETMSGTWTFRYTTDASSSYNSMSLTQCSSMTANCVLNLDVNASAPAQVVVTQTIADLTLPHGPKTWLHSTNCSNRFSNVSGPVLALEYMNAGSASPTAYAGWCFGTRKWLTTTNAGGTCTWALPVTAVGMRIGLIRTDAVVARFDPNGTEIIRGGGAGKYFQTNTDGASAILRCDTAGIWEIEQQQGTWTFEP